MNQAVVEELFDRSEYACEANTPDCIGQGQKIHHRRLRRQGGGDELDNLLHVCNPCHLFIHAHPAMSYDAGWMIRSHGRPRER